MTELAKLSKTEYHGFAVPEKSSKNPIFSVKSKCFVTLYKSALFRMFIEYVTSTVTFSRPTLCSCFMHRRILKCLSCFIVIITTNNVLFTYLSGPGRNLWRRRVGFPDIQPCIYFNSVLCVKLLFVYLLFLYLLSSVGWA